MNITDHLGTAVTGISRLLTIREVADLAGVSIMTVRRWIADHGLRAHRLGRLVRISQEDLAGFFIAKRNDANPTS